MNLEPLFDMSWVTLIMLLGIMCVAGIVHGTLGLGFPMIATPLLSLLFDVRTAILITLLPTAVVNIASIIKGGNWRHNIAHFWPLPLYALVGGLFGAWLIVDNDPAPYKLALALLILLYLATTNFSSAAFNWSQSYPRWTILGFGITAGIAAGSTNVMVPILIIYTLGLGLMPTAMVQIFNLTFLAGKVAQLIAFGFAGHLDLEWLQTTSPLALTGLAALFIGMKVRDRIPTKAFKRIIKAVLVVIAIMLIVQYVRYAMA